MMVRIPVLVAALLLFVAPVQSTGQTVHDGVEAALGLAVARDSGVEVRVWVGGSLRVSTLFRLVRMDTGVSAERIAWTRVVHPAPGEYSQADARRETQSNRRFLEKERCVGPAKASKDFLWCKVAIRVNKDWSDTFDDLLLDQLWALPPQGASACRSTVVVDGEAVGIDVLERGRRVSVEYWNPDSCCRTVACAIANHVRSVVQHVY
jgi:hypothetical protein